MSSLRAITRGARGLAAFAPHHRAAFHTKRAAEPLVWAVSASHARGGACRCAACASTRPQVGRGLPARGLASTPEKVCANQLPGSRCFARANLCGGSKPAADAVLRCRKTLGPSTWNPARGPTLSDLTPSTMVTITVRTPLPRSRGPIHTGWGETLTNRTADRFQELITAELSKFAPKDRQMRAVGRFLFHFFPSILRIARMHTQTDT